MSEVPPPDVFEPEELFRRLVDGGVDFIVVGGFAVNLNGYIRATADIGIVPNPSRDNLGRIANLLRELGARPIGVDTDLLPSQPTTVDGLAAGGSFQLSTYLGQLDLLQGGQGVPSYQSLAPGAWEAEYKGMVLRVCSYEDLKTMKRAAGRHRDLDDLENLALAREPDE